MALLKEKKFSFMSLSSQAKEDTFAVVSFKGFEAISSLYDFEIILVTENTDIDISDVLENPAQFIIHRDDEDPVLFNGILAEFEEQREYKGIIFYRARLVPKTWWLTLTHHNQVCLDSSVNEIIEQTLKDGGLFSRIDFDFDLQKEYSPMEYICQYGETHFDFASRWAQREGIYYFFEQSENGEKLIFTDTKIVHKNLKLGDTLHYSPVSGLDAQQKDEVIQSFTCRQQMLPAKVFLKDYNYEKPSLEMVGEADVDLKGRGEKYIYGEYFNSPEEGSRLASLRAEELFSRKKEFFGESTVPFINPGYTFDLKDHYRNLFNSKYLVTKVTHYGHQKGYLTAGLSEVIATEEKQMSYENEFTAIPSDVQFRPELITEKPKISGTIHANIDAETDGEYAELDDQGRYRVRLPFDLNSDHGDGKASAYVRMMQPYAGAKEGMHFPLRKGTEVLLTFIDGNPDRPVIAGAIPNPETVSPVNASNQTESVIRTKGDNKIRIEDKKDTERIIMQSPKVNSYVRIGTPNDPYHYINVSKDIIYVDRNGSLPTGWNSYAEKGTYTNDNSLVNDSATTESDDTVEYKVGVTPTTISTATPAEHTITFTITPFKAAGGKWEVQSTETLTRKLVVKDTHEKEYLEDLKEGDGIKLQTDGGIELYTGTSSLLITTLNPTDINLESATGDINQRAGNVNTFASKDAWDATWGNQYSSIIGNNYEFSLANNYSFKGATETNLTLGSSVLDATLFGNKLEYSLGLAFNLEIGRKFELFLGDEYDEGFMSWRKHSNKDICIDAEGKIEIIGGGQNNSKITGETGSLKLEYGTFEDSSSDNPLEKMISHGFPALITHIAAVGAGSLFTALPWTLLDEETSDDKKVTDMVFSASTAAFTGLAAAIAIVLIGAKKKKVTKQTQDNITVNETKSEILLGEPGISIEAAQIDMIAGKDKNGKISIYPSGTIEFTIPDNKIIEIDSSQKGKIKIGGSIFKSSEVSIGAGKNLIVKK